MLLLLRGLHCCAAVLELRRSEGSPLVAASGPLIVVASLVAEQRPQGAQASAVAVPGLYGTGLGVVACTGLAASRQVGSSQIRNPSLVSRLGRRIVYL